MIGKILRILACAAALSAAAASGAEISVFAAASLSEALTDAGAQFTAATGNTVTFNFGASGTLVRQIEEGARADVIVSADQSHVDRLERAGLLLPGSRRTILANALVVVVPIENGPSIAGLGDLTAGRVHRIAIGEPGVVPAGTYAKACLTKAGLWTLLSDRLVPLDNVRSVLAAVASGDADAGFVYRTDAMRSKRVRVAVDVAASATEPITYPAAVLRESEQPDAARRFVAYLADSRAQAVFARYGFLPAR